MAEINRLAVCAREILALTLLLFATSSCTPLGKSSAPPPSNNVTEGTHAPIGSDLAVGPLHESGPTPAEGNRLDQWSVGVSRPALGTPYLLRNLVRNAAFYIKPGEASVFDWQAEGSADWEFRKDPTSNRLAIVNVQTGRYLATGEGTVIYPAIKSTYQWQWYATTGNRIALYNTVKHDYLVYDVNSMTFRQLNWKFHPLPQPPEPVFHDATVTLHAQPPVQGYVPFLGSYGGGLGNTNVLIEVSNPQLHNTSLFFIKPGYSSSQCAQSEATFTLAPGAKMTSAQMATLWGSATPSLNHALPFLACAATDKSLVFVNIRYQEH